MKLSIQLSGKAGGGDIAVAMATTSNAAWRLNGRFHIAFFCGTGHQHQIFTLPSQMSRYIAQSPMKLYSGRLKEAGLFFSKPK